MSPAQMKKAYQKGASLGEIAKKADICIPTARKQLVALKVQIRGVGRPASK